MTNETLDSLRTEQWQIIGQIASAHIRALARQGSFDDDISATLLAACDNVIQAKPKGDTLLAAVLAFDEHLDALVPAQLHGVASMGRGSIEVCQAVSRIMLRTDLTATGAGALAVSDALLKFAGVHIVTMLPIWAGNQPLQPTTLAGLLGGPIGAIFRSVELLEFAIAQINQSALGAGVGTSTRFAPDRAEMATELGFDQPISSVYDAISATDHYALGAASIEAIVGGAVDVLRQLDQLIQTLPDAIVFADGDSGQLPDVPQLRRTLAIDRCFSLAREANRATDGVRAWSAVVPPGPKLDLDEPLELLRTGTVATIELLEELGRLFSGGFEVNRAVLGNRSNKGHLTASDIVDFLVIEEEINPADARIIAGRVLTHLQVNGLEIAAIDRGMIDAAGLLVVGREIGIEFETLSKYLAPRRFLEGRTADGGPDPGTMRDWLTHETAAVKRKRAAFEAMRLKWDSVRIGTGSADADSVS